MDVDSILGDGWYQKNITFPWEGGAFTFAKRMIWYILYAIGIPATVRAVEGSLHIANVGQEHLFAIKAIPRLFTNDFCSQFSHKTTSRGKKSSQFTLIPEKFGINDSRFSISLENTGKK